MARLGFIRKVYGILSVQLAITVAWCWLVLKNEGVQNFVVAYWVVWWLMIFVMIGTLLFMVCNLQLTRIVPYNYLLLFGFTVAEAYLVGIVCLEYDPTIVLIAAGMTLGITIVLTAYACLTNRDFTITIGAMISALWCLIGLIIIGLFLRAYWLETAISAVGVFIYGMYIIIDT